MREELVLQQDVRVIYDFRPVSRDPKTGETVDEIIIRKVEDKGRDHMGACALEGVRVVIRTDNESVFLKDGKTALTEQEMRVLELLYTRPGPFPDDHVYGTTRPVRVGQEWQIDNMAYAQNLNAAGILLSPVEPENIEGWVRLETVEEEVAHVRSRAEFREIAPEQHPLMHEIQSTIEEQISLPLDLEAVSPRREARIVNTLKPRANELGIKRMVVTIHLITELTKVKQGVTLKAPLKPAEDSD